MVDKKEYQKKYYEENKEKTKENNMEKQKIRRIKKILDKLNKDCFSRFPYSKIEKYNIKYDENKTPKYYI